MHAGINKLPNLSRICYLTVGATNAIVHTIAPVALGDAIDATDFSSSLHQKISARASDLVLDTSDDHLSALAIEKSTQTDSIPEAAPNSANPPPVNKQPTETLEQTIEDVENPIVNRISIPIVNRTAFGIGPFQRTANVKMQAYFVPKPGKNFAWGIGPTFLLPTASDRRLGFGKWGVGPAVVAVWSEKRLTLGGRIENYWSVAGDEARPNVSQFTMQPFVTYTLGDGWYLVAAPVIVAFWNIPGEQWLVPVGGGIGKVMKLGTFPLCLSVQAYWHAGRVVRRDGRLSCKHSLYFHEGSIYSS